KFKSDRIYGNINLGLQANDWLSFQLQSGTDITQSGDRVWHNVNSPAVGSWNAGGNTEGQSRAADVGNTVEESQKYFEYDTKLNAMFKKKLSPSFNIDGLIGTNYNDRGSRLLSTGIEGLAIPGFFQLSNSANKPRSTESDSHRRLLGAYAQATMGYKDYLYLTLSGRNDWSSTLPKGKNSFFYPAANLAFILSQALDMNSSSAVSFAKLRASYGQTGSDTDPYRINNVINATSIGLGFGNILFPINNVAGFSISNQLNNQNLSPEKTTEFELGGELRFLNDRFGIDANYYHKITSDQIIPVAISPATGYTSIILNATKVRNQGFEVLFNATPVKTSSVNWNLAYTFARDRSMVLELAEGLEKLVLKSVYDAQLVAVKGQPLGIIQAPTASYDPAGHIIVDSKGYPVADPTNKTYGSIQSDYQMGLQNSLSYKNLSLGFSMDYRKGGVFYSGTADLLNFVGADVKTTYNDRRPFIVPNSVQAVTDAAGNVTGYVENTVQITEPNVDDYYYPTNNKALAYNNRILDKSYLKLREVTLSYALPTSVAAKIRADKAVISIYGRNLYTWLAKGNRTVDPEVSNLGNDISSELGEFRTAPPVRFFGASLKLSF
ncbi:MAG TPA: SusC/RagA family TonB-linked outer membrane protein, partial [Sphingobacteriaceae bacterium]|nr:SusC/RagA family TonB-linked outer membrane protein [Sphingobacteriaceae bacterium]